MKETLCASVHMVRRKVTVGDVLGCVYVCVGVCACLLISIGAITNVGIEQSFCKVFPHFFQKVEVRSLFDPYPIIENRLKYKCNQILPNNIAT